VRPSGLASRSVGLALVLIAASACGETASTAYQNHLEQETGSIEVGKLADLVVLERNLFEVPRGAGDENDVGGKDGVPAPLAGS
jgi:hypothetical protein